MTTLINLGGESRPFCVGIGSLIEFEKKTGKNFIQMAESPDMNLSLTDLCTLAYCCLLVGARARAKNFEYEEYEIIDWIDEEAGALAYISALITEGLGKLGTPEKKSKRQTANGKQAKAKA